LLLAPRSPQVVAAAAPGPGALRQEGGWRRKRPSPQSCCGAAEHRPPQPTSPVGYWASPRREEGKAAASRSLRGSWRRRLAHPGPSGRGGRGARCSGPNPGRCGDSTAPRGRPHPCPARRRRQRNGLVKLRLTDDSSAVKKQETALILKDDGMARISPQLYTPVTQSRSQQAFECHSARRNIHPILNL
ncbi:PREDICTED: uncharacterized protein LOC105577840, partial [Cercocebus atys]|uniref:uncharacterized protein LOC105577840 n=1 Tax=Cercocebus atys TaxID=9531 RepID=UPI0005F3AC4B